MNLRSEPVTLLTETPVHSYCSALSPFRHKRESKFTVRDGSALRLRSYRCAAGCHRFPLFAGLNSCNSASLLPSEKRNVSKSDKRTDRTTKMLVAVLMLFLITEFPQGILGLLSVMLGRCFFRTCYYLFGDVMDILALLNGAINFILYCSMSRQFRTTFALLFKPRMLRKWSTPASQTDVQSTYV
jgi:hypothetical protein